MQKILKTLLISILSIAAICFACFAAGCGSDKKSGGNDNYTVVLKYSDGTAVNGLTDGNEFYGETDSETVIKVQWCSAAAGGTCAQPIVLGEDGTLTVTSAFLKNYGGSPYHVKLLGVKTDLYDVDKTDILGDKENAFAGYEVTEPTTITVILTAKTAA